MAPAVSIILPTYNRASFLPEALASIRAQSFRDWELVVVDDGSTDQTRALVESWRREVTQPVSYVWQENRGAYAARNAGLDRAGAPLVAFFDSDDLWRPSYLEACVEGLRDQPDVDWVFTACEMVNAQGKIICRSTFLEGERPRPFLSLRATHHGDLRVITDERAIECHVTQGIFCGLQNSVIRARVFDAERFWPDYRVVEDAQFLLRALVRGVRLAYLTQAHVVYRIHDANSSASAAGANRRQLRSICEEKVRGLERLRRELTLTRKQRRAMNAGLAHVYFWQLGYACCWEMGDSAGALSSMQSALRLTPFRFWMWKTYVGCQVSRYLRRTRFVEHDGPTEV